MLMQILAIVAGTSLLLYGADRFVIGASATARNFGLSPMLIGLTIAGFATSAPEILVSATASLKGASDLAVGNALGSNIANIGLVLGAAVLVKPIMISESKVLRREMPVLMILSLLSILVFTDDYLSFIDGVTLLITFVIFMLWVVWVGLLDKRANTADSSAKIPDVLTIELNAERPKDITTSTSLFWLALGFAILLGGSNILVWGAENLARQLGISELIIGLTIVAIGTSLPELAVTVTSAYKGEAGLAIGNIVGSNIYNLLAVIGVAGVIHPTALEPEVRLLHLPVMIAFTIGLYLLTYNNRNNGEARINRGHGVLLLVAFIGYHLNNLI